MESKLSEQEIQECRELLKKAEPFADDDPELLIFDDHYFMSKSKMARHRATTAKWILEAHGIPLEEPSDS